MPSTAQIYVWIYFYIMYFLTSTIKVSIRYLESITQALQVLTVDYNVMSVSRILLFIYLKLACITIDTKSAELSPTRRYRTNVVDTCQAVEILLFQMSLL
jgi:hypothetical protein